MEEEDLKFLAEILNQSSWLFYGDLEEHFDIFLRTVFSHELKEWGFGDVKMSPDFTVAYWLLISELNRLGLVDYGTSPRGAWLTEKGEKFKKLVMKNNDAIAQTEEFIYRENN